ncbi:PIN domain-containing protein [Azohydromonas australica]|uniref:PIN domain-containing protein n=1 Tax=Azohydromonas australica TaxID=364039 RepID=UPI000684116D|nr:PIN domain-containing protein [Azohydromonas australica]
MSDMLPPTLSPIAESHAAPQAAHTGDVEVPTAVLDSNAVLDWLLFDDPSMQPLGQAIRTGHCRWIVTPALRNELEHVLARGLHSRPQADTGPLWETWQRLACPVEPPADAPPPPGLRCTDGDDQKFLAVALAHRARWLVSRDRALLKLRRRARERGLLILTPAQWSLEATAMPG